MSGFKKIANIETGTVTGQLAYWDTDEWKHVESSEIFWDDTNKRLGIGTSAPNANALLDITSTTKAFMPPRMTSTQKGNIASPTAGMVIYDATLAKLCVYTTAWETVTSA